MALSPWAQGKLRTHEENARLLSLPPSSNALRSVELALDEQVRVNARCRFPMFTRSQRQRLQESATRWDVARQAGSAQVWHSRFSR